jgi:hypothetical protein
MAEFDKGSTVKPSSIGEQLEVVKEWWQQIDK